MLFKRLLQYLQRCKGYKLLLLFNFLVLAETAKERLFSAFQSRTESKASRLVVQTGDGKECNT